MSDDEDRIKMMEAFDRLPLIVREAIRNAAFTHPPATAELYLVRYGMSAKEVAAFIREQDEDLKRQVSESGR